MNEYHHDISRLETRKDHEIGKKSSGIREPLQVVSTNNQDSADGGGDLSAVAKNPSDNASVEPKCKEFQQEVVLSEVERLQSAEFKKFDSPPVSIDSSPGPISAVSVDCKQPKRCTNKTYTLPPLDFSQLDKIADKENANFKPVWGFPLDPQTNVEANLEDIADKWQKSQKLPEDSDIEQINIKKQKDMKKMLETGLDEFNSDQKRERRQGVRYHLKRIFGYTVN